MPPLTPPPESSFPNFLPISYPHHTSTQTHPQRRSNKRKRKIQQVLAQAGEGENQDTIPRSDAPFLKLPKEIHFRIFELLEDTFDGICFSLVCKKLNTLTSPFVVALPLSSGSPSSATPHPHATGCRHCVPVLFSPAHCELHFHIRSFFPRRFNYCSNCDRFTVSEGGGEKGGKGKCDGCGVEYRRRFERGRRALAVEGRERKLRRGSRWFNVFG